MACPIIPMSVLSGAPTRAEIFEYIRLMHGVGIDRIMLYPRKGCEIEYMSEKWWKTVRDVIDALVLFGMQVFINDDFHFPSGNADGKVTENPDFCLKSITVAGENRGRRNLVTPETPKEKRFADVLSYDAITEFINQSHLKYYEKFGEYFGNVILGFYTDEPAACYFCGEDDIPYYFGMENDYLTSFGRDFDADLESGNADFIKNCFELISNRFADCYAKQISAWCEGHGVLLAGHLLDDDRPARSLFASGDFTKVLPEFSLPGIDDIRTDFDDPYLLSVLGCAELAKSEIGAMAEIFALGPCDMPFSKQIAMIYLCAAFGINHYFAAISHINVKGNRPINNYFSHFGPARPDFDGMRLLCKEAENAAALSAVGFVPDVYVTYPVTRYAKSAAKNQPDGDFAALLAELSERQLQWKYLREGETASDGIKTVALSEEGFLLLDGVKMPKDKVLSSVSVPARVTEADGSLPKKLFVRRNPGGDLTVINLSPEERNLKIAGESVRLCGYEVFTGKKESFDVCAKYSGTFDIGHENQNKARMMYLNSETRAELECNGDFDVVFSVREECTASLDGERLGVGACHSIGIGFDGLYRDSGKIHLSKGLHTVICGNDYKYLPSVLLSGEFSVEYASGDVCRAILSERKSASTAGEHFEDFGCAVFSFETEIPADADRIKISGEAVCVSLTIDGEDAGEAIAPPYIFRLPRGICGKHRFEIRQYSSLGSLFGDANYFNYHQDCIRWRSTKPSHPAIFGIDGVELLKTKT